MKMGCSKKMFEVLPEAKDVSFVFLSLEDDKGNVVSRNEYVLAEVMDKHDWSKYRWWRTQIESYGDFSALDDLAPADVEVKVLNKVFMKSAGFSDSWLKKLLI